MGSQFSMTDKQRNRQPGKGGACGIDPASIAREALAKLPLGFSAATAPPELRDECLATAARIVACGRAAEIGALAVREVREFAETLRCLELLTVVGPVMESCARMEQSVNFIAEHDSDAPEVLQSAERESTAAEIALAAAQARADKATAALKAARRVVGELTEARKTLETQDVVIQSAWEVWKQAAGL